jgi:protein-tyrosine phosphatase
MTAPFADIHCHVLPGIDDGAKTWEDSLEMARLAVADGITTIVATPHQLGTLGAASVDEIRELTAELNNRLQDEEIPLSVLPGAEVRIESDLVSLIADGEVLTLGDHRRHVLVELPHELYLPMDLLLHNLSVRRITAILAHPERNQGLLRQQDLVPKLVDAGCLMQITAGSLCGVMGPAVQQMAEWMVAEGYVHFVSTDAHGPRTRRPLMGSAFDRLLELVDEQTAEDLCCRYPMRVARGRSVTAGRRTVQARRRSGWWERRASA